MNRIYNADHVEFIKKNITGCSFKYLTDMFNRQFGMTLKISAMISLADRHGLHNGRDTRLNKGHEPTYFRKGHAPINKGTKGMFNVGGNRTSFKKGNRSHNWVPLGSERVTKDGYIQVKIDEGKFQNNWRGKHILIWEKHNGPLPKSHAIIFGDGDSRNFDINNLLLVSRSQLLTLNRNSLIKNDAELTQTGIVIANVLHKIAKAQRSD